MQHHPHHRPPRPLLAMRRAPRRRPHQPGPLQRQSGHRVAQLVVMPLQQLLVKMLHREARYSVPHTDPACAGSPRPPRGGSTACRSAGRASPPAPRRAAGRASAGTSAPTSPASRPPLLAPARLAHGDPAMPQNASVVPLAALLPGPFPAPLSGGSKTGQITRYKIRTDHESSHKTLDKEVDPIIGQVQAPSPI